MAGAHNLGGGYVLDIDKVQRISARIRSIRREMKRDDLAERISVHGDLSRASDEIGISRSYGRLLWSEIKRGLGRQAQ